MITWSIVNNKKNSYVKAQDCLNDVLNVRKKFQEQQHQTHEARRNEVETENNKINEDNDDNGFIRTCGEHQKSARTEKVWTIKKGKNHG